MIAWIKRLFAKKTCRHLRLIEIKWLSPDGTPMGQWQCQDCPWIDIGHVHANAQEWVKQSGPFYDPLYDDLDSAYPNPPWLQGND